jgi:hypothetical protein
MRVVMILGVVFASACARFPPPTDTLAESIATARRAAEIGAPHGPQASLSLQLAREQITRAKKLMASGEHEQAHYQALRALNDAEVAIAITREEQARDQARKAELEAATAAASVNP